MLAFSHTSLIPYVLAHTPGRLGPVFEKFYPRVDPALIWVSVRSGDHVFKYRNRGDGAFLCEVFDHAVDFGETTNLYDASDPLHREMLAKLEDYKAYLVEDCRRRLDSGERNDHLPPDQQMQLLRALGYVND